MLFYASFTLVSCLASVAAISKQDGEAGYRMGTVYLDTKGQYSFKEGVMDKVEGVAYGYYNNTLNETGWGVLEVRAGGCGRGVSNVSCTDSQAMYAAGMLEGVLTAKQIWQHYQNLRPFFLPPSPDTPKLEKLLRQWFDAQDAWMRGMIKSEAETDPFWTQAQFVVAHLDGLYAGYASVADKTWETDLFVLQFLNAVGDLIDLNHVIDPSSRPDFARMSHAEFRAFVFSSGHCSALVKVTGGYEDVFMAHSSWFIYAATLRIYKHYHLQLEHSSTAAHSISFSSYPGFLESLDDFYVMDSGLVMLQTTINVFNMTLYNLVTPSSLLAWQRVRIANSISRSGRDWAGNFSRYNSGTYNNQYMVVDLKLIHPLQSLDDDSLWVIEQIPGLVASADQTPILRTGYWPSYNVPFYKSIYDAAGYPGMVKQRGVDYSYQLAPRAKIFRRDTGAVRSFSDTMDLMRYNDYKNDWYSKGDARNAICSRGDLNNGGPAIGCYDTKVTSYSLALGMASLVINGPTTSHGLPPFSWTGRFANQSHSDLPLEYNFDWQPMVPHL